MVTSRPSRRGDTVFLVLCVFLVAFLVALGLGVNYAKHKWQDGHIRAIVREEMRRALPR